MASFPGSPGLKDRIEQLAHRLAESERTRRTAEAEVREARLRIEQYESAGLAPPADAQTPPPADAQGTAPADAGSAPPADAPTTTGMRQLADRVELLRRQLDQSVRRNLGLQEDLDTTRRRLQAAVQAATTQKPPSPTARVELSAHTRRLASKTRHLLTDLEQISHTGLLRRPELARESDQFHTTLGLAEVALRSLMALPKASPTEAAQQQAIASLLSLLKDRTAAMRARVSRADTALQLTEQVDQLFDEVRAGQPVPFREVNHVARQVVRDVHDWPTSGLRLPYHSGRHGYLASHSLNVARLATYLGLQCQPWRERVVTTAAAAVIHDLGMVQVPRALIDQPGPLEADDLRIIHEHPNVGAYLTQSMEGIDPLLTESVVQHHERLDGSGYPQHRRSDQVCDLARLLAVVDGYESMVSPRSWRQPVLPREAMGETVLSAEHGKLDKRWVEKFLSLSFYPVGSYVQLSSGELARVVAAATGDHRHAARPVVQLLTDTDGHRLWQSEFLNLAACPDRYIVRAVPSDAAEATLESALAV